MDYTNLRTDLYQTGEYVSNSIKLSVSTPIKDLENIILFETLIQLLFQTDYTMSVEERHLVEDVLHRLIKDDNNIKRFKKYNIDGRN